MAEQRAKISNSPTGEPDSENGDDKEWEALRDDLGDILAETGDAPEADAGPEGSGGADEAESDGDEPAAKGKGAKAKGAKDFFDHLDELRSHFSEKAQSRSYGDRRREALESLQKTVEGPSEPSADAGAIEAAADAALADAEEGAATDTGDVTAPSEALTEAQASADDTGPAQSATASSLQAAVEKIRSTRRSSIEGNTSPSLPPAGGQERGFGEVIEMTSQLGERMGDLERSVTDRFEKLPDATSISRQMEALSETVDQLSEIVRNAADTSGLETRIADILGVERQDPAVERLESRMERLNESVRKLADIQVRKVKSDTDDGGDGEGEATATEHMEASIRAIYDKLDAFEHSAGVNPEEMERLSERIGKLAATLDESSGRGDVGDELIERINAIATHVESLEPSEGSVGFVELKDEIGTLRRYMVEAFEPRFDALEERIKELGSRIAGGVPDGIGQELLEEQLKLLISKVDQTSEALTALNARQAEASQRQLPDAAELVDLIAAKTASEVAAQKPADSIGISNIALSALRESIAQVERRLDNLQDALKRLHKAQQPGSLAPQAAVAPLQAAMSPGAQSAPLEAVAGEVAAAAAQAAKAETSSPIDEMPAPYLPPAKGELPPKPESSLGQSADDIFKRAAEKARVESSEAALAARSEDSRDRPRISRESFIEAARRAARRTAEPSVLDADGGFLGKALARLKRKDGEIEDATPEQGETDEAEADDESRAPEPTPAEPAAADEVVIEEPDAEDHRDDEPESFLSQHRRPILLAASFVAIGLMTLNLISQRIGGGEDLAIEPATIELGSGSLDEVAEAPTIGLEPGEEPAPADVRKVGAVADAEPMLDTGTDAFEPDAQGIVTGSIDPQDQVAALGPPALRDAAEAGDPRAQFEIAAMYTEGQVTAQDYSAAAMWYGRAAGSGFAPAAYRLGNLYEYGRGVDEDLEEAKRWYQAAAQAGNRMAMHNLAALYAGGQLETQDFASAALWFERAAWLGVKDSQFNLGMLYARGLGVDQDFVQSYRWFALAALGGDADAAKARDDIARSLDADSLRRADALVESWRMGDLDIAANYAPLGTWDANFDPGEEVTDPGVVRQVQQLLAKLGYEIGEPDGIAGPKTEISIREFESVIGMPPSGKINPRLLAVLATQPV